MFKQIKQLFSSIDQQDYDIEQHDLKTAVAALLIEVMRADNDLQADEQHTLSLTLKKYFDLTDEAVDELTEQASASLDDAKVIQLYQCVAVHYIDC